MSFFGRLPSAGDLYSPPPPEGGQKLNGIIRAKSLSQLPEDPSPHEHLSSFSQLLKKPNEFISHVVKCSVERDKKSVANNPGLAKILAVRRMTDLKIAMRNKYIKGDLEVKNALDIASNHLTQTALENKSLQEKLKQWSMKITELKKERDHWKANFKREAVHRAELIDLRHGKERLDAEIIAARKMAEQAARTSKDLMDTVEVKWQAHHAKIMSQSNDMRLRARGEMMWKVDVSTLQGCEFVNCGFRKVVNSQKAEILNLEKEIKRLNFDLKVKNEREKQRLFAEMKKGTAKRYSIPCGMTATPLDVRAIKIVKDKRAPKKLRVSGKNAVPLEIVLEDVWWLFCLKIGEDLKCDLANQARVNFPDLMQQAFVLRTGCLQQGNTKYKEFCAGLTTWCTKNDICGLFAKSCGLIACRKVSYSARIGDFLSRALQRLVLLSKDNVDIVAAINRTSKRMSADTNIGRVIWKMLQDELEASDMKISYLVALRAGHSLFPSRHSHVRQSVDTIQLSKNRRSEFLKELRALFQVPENHPIVKLHQNRERNSDSPGEIQNATKVAESFFDTALVELVANSREITTHISEAFSSLDLSKNGVVKIKDFRAVLSGIGFSITMGEVLNLQENGGIVNDEFLDYNKFIEYCKTFKDRQKLKLAFSVNRTRAAVIIQNAVRIRLRKLKFKLMRRRQRAALLIQSQVRAYLIRRLYVVTKDGALRPYLLRYGKKHSTLEKVLLLFFRHFELQEAENKKRILVFFRERISGGVKDEDGTLVEKPAINFETFTHLMNACSLRLFRRDDMLRMFIAACKESKTLKLYEEQWVRLCIHYGISPPFDVIPSEKAGDPETEYEQFLEAWDASKYH